MMPHFKTALCSSLMLFTLTTITIGIGASNSEAGRRGHANNDDYVVAESRFGNGTVVGPVRHTRVGRQVRTPGGSWLHCARSCSETLRVNTVDFWQNEEGAGDEAAIDQQDGLLSRWLHWPRRR